MPTPVSHEQERERWNKRFAEEGYHFGTEPNAFLVSQAGRLAPGMSALSVGDGEGRNSVWLAQRGLKVTAFDFSPVALEKAKALARASGVPSRLTLTRCAPILCLVRRTHARSPERARTDPTAPGSFPSTAGSRWIF